MQAAPTKHDCYLFDSWNWWQIFLDARILSPSYFRTVTQRKRYSSKIICKMSRSKWASDQMSSLCENISEFTTVDMGINGFLTYSADGAEKNSLFLTASQISVRQGHGRMWEKVLLLLLMADLWRWGYFHDSRNSSSMYSWRSTHSFLPRYWLLWCHGRGDNKLRYCRQWRVFHAIIIFTYD